jgi:glutamate/tyrosine decarboxylase-like PLP-dependent enzyme
MLDTPRGLLKGGVPLVDRGFELTRSFRALKVWICLMAYGVERFQKCIRANLQQAAYFDELIQQDPNLESMAPVPMNIVCFRYVGAAPDRTAASAGDLATDRLNAFNQELLLRLQESGQAVLSSTWIDGQFVLRAAITNHRTQASDIRQVAEAVVRMGQEMEQETR